MNIISSIAIIVIAFILQVKAYRKTKSYRKTLQNIFPTDPEIELTADFDETGNVQIAFTGDGDNKSGIFRRIVYAINSYLSKNKGVTDYSTLKDIADRESDTVEQQIESTAPVPIYLGLCGTLVGIVLGVAVLGFGGGIESLFQYRESTEQIVGSANAELDAGASGIKSLLCGVAIAMITTLIGVVLTIIGSYSKSQKINEDKKNRFLSWMQGELLPQMKHNMVSTLNILQQNLSKFNTDFASNSQSLNDIFKSINNTYKENATLLEAVQSLDIDGMANANIRVLRELQACTSQINDLHSFLEQSNHYVSDVESLNHMLNEHLDRTKLIENLGEFFKTEVEQIQIRKRAISDAVGELDLEVQKSMEGLAEHTKSQYQKLTKATSAQHLEFQNAIAAQQKTLEERLGERSLIIKHLEKLSSTEEHINEILGALKVQNGRIDKLTDIVASVGKRESSTQQTEMPDIIVPVRKPSVWAVLTGGAVSTVVVGTCVIVILNILGII